jgi:hypothetical protein
MGESSSALTSQAKPHRIDLKMRLIAASASSLIVLCPRDEGGNTFP